VVAAPCIRKRCCQVQFVEKVEPLPLPHLQHRKKTWFFMKGNDFLGKTSIEESYTRGLTWINEYRLQSKNIDHWIMSPPPLFIMHSLLFLNQCRMLSSNMHLFQWIFMNLIYHKEKQIIWQRYKALPRNGVFLIWNSIQLVLITRNSIVHHESLLNMPGQTYDMRDYTQRKPN